MKNFYLFIDTHSHKKMYFAVYNKRVCLGEQCIQTEKNYQEVFFPRIVKYIEKWGGVRSLAGIGIVTGPGDFSSLRSGMAFANALAWACNIPIVSVKKSHLQKKHIYPMRLFSGKKSFIKPCLPTYGKAPHIT